MEKNKPTPEEIFNIIDNVEYAKRHTYLPPKDRQKIMAKKIVQLFEFYHKEKLREELIKFMDIGIDAYGHDTNIKIVDEYLKQKQ